MRHGALLLIAVAAAAQDKLPSADEVLTKAIERSAWADAQKVGRKYVFKTHSINEEFDGNGAVKSHEERVTQLVPLGPNLRSRRLIEKNGKPPSEADLQAQREREKKLLAGGTQRKRPQSPSNPDDEVMFNHRLVDNYNWKIWNREEIAGRTTYLLTFEPKSKDLPIRRMADRILNKLAGKVWIDSQEFELVRADAHLTENASMWGGLAGSLRKADLFFEQMRLDDGAWLDHKFELRIDGRVAFKTMRQHTIEEFSDYQKVTPELIAQVKN